MMYDVMLSVILIFIFIICMIVLILAYNNYPKSKNVIEIIKGSSFLVKVIISILFLFSIVFTVSYMKSPFNLPSIVDNSSEFYTLVDDGDGIIVVGRTRHSASNPGERSYIYETSRAYIVKYSYSGEILWDDVYFIKDNVSLSSVFTNVYINDEGNKVASGTFGGHYDGYSLWEVVYNSNGEVINYKSTPYDIHSLLPNYLSDTEDLKFSYNLVDYETRVYELTIEYTDIDTNVTVTNKQEFEAEIITKYNNREPRVSVIYSDSESIIVGVSMFNMRDVLVYNQLMIFDHSLNLSKTVNLSDGIVPGKIYKENDQLYMLSRNDVARKSSLVMLQSNYEEERIYSIDSDYDYFVANDIIITDDEIYIGGNEYETRTKEGFVEYFSGVINVYDLDMSLKETIKLQTGVGLNSMMIIDDEIFTVGLFNTSIGLSKSITNDYSWCGVFSVVNEDKQNYVLGFTRRADRVR